MLSEAESNENERLIETTPTRIKIECSQGKVVNPDTYQAMLTPISPKAMLIAASEDTVERVSIFA